MKAKSVLTLLLFAAFAFCGSAYAQNIVKSDQPESILDIAKGFGSAELEKDDEGDPAITGRIEGTKYKIFFYGCEKNKNCTSIQFQAGWALEEPLSMEKINEWNSKKRYVKAYLDEEGDPWLELDVELEYGTTFQNLEESFRNWNILLKEFKETML